MRASVASLSHKLVAALAAFTLTFSMAPLAWADDAPAVPAASMAAGSAENASETASGEGPDAQQAPEASAQSADTKAADGGSAGAAGTTVKIEVYRSSYPLVWDLNDAGAAEATKAQWGNKPDGWPAQGSPGSAVGTCEGYVPWKSDSEPGSEPTRLGFNFMGWSTKPDIAVEGTGKLDALSIPKDAELVAGDDGVKRITLYALWAPVEYSVVFDLTKNPEDASAVPSFDWTTGKGAFSDLGGGRYRLSGVTLQDYDPETGLIEIATPARGTGGYRFLSWAEPDSQLDPAVAVMKEGSSKWYVNPVALPHYDYEPVLTARWALSFDVDVPSQVTFDQYDSLEVEGNLTDATDQDTVDEESSDAHDAGKQAHFCSQSTASDYKIVALKSTRQPTAEKILTTSDSSKASQEDVLGGEKLLSLFAQGAASEDQGVHFKLDDAVDMDDSSRYGAFVIPKQQAGFDPSATDRDDEERLYVSYRLNLSNLVDGSDTPNHGLVTPGNVNERDRTPIAEVSYEFAVADDEVTEAIPGDPLYIEDNGTIYGLDYIKRAADDLSANGTASSYHSQFKNWLDEAAAFKLRVGNAYHDVQVLGICQDNLTTPVEGRTKAGLTFGFKELYTRSGMAANNAAGWNGSWVRALLQGDFYNQLDSAMQSNIARVTKVHQQVSPSKSLQVSTNQTVFIPSMFEVFGGTFSTSGLRHNASEVKSDARCFQYQYFAKGGQSNRNLVAQKTWNGNSQNYWLRGAGYDFTGYNLVAGNAYVDSSSGTTSNSGVLPCFAL